MRHLRFVPLGLVASAALVLFVACGDGGQPPAPATGRIAFLSDGYLSVMNADGSDATRLADRGGFSAPAWSPDGSPIAIDSAGVIAVTNVDATGTSLIYSGRNNASSFTWSPDGSRIAFVSAELDSEPTVRDIYVMNADGSGQTNVTNVRDLSSLDPGGFLPEYFIQPEGFIGVTASISWSPDSERIAFDVGSFGRDIYVINTDGSGFTRLVNSGAFPAWSPDGSLIAFVHGSRFGEGVRDIYVISADGTGGPANLTGGLPSGEAGRGVQSPVWSPNGSRIAFVHWTLRRTEDIIGLPGVTADVINVYAVNADGSGLTRLGEGSSPLTWSPNGMHIAFESCDTTDFLLRCDIYVVNSDGSGLINLTDGPARDRSPVWSPVP